MFKLNEDIFIKINLFKIDEFSTKIHRYRRDINMIKEYKKYPIEPKIDSTGQYIKQLLA